MQGVLGTAHECLRRDEAFAFATIIQTKDSETGEGPRLGSKLLVRASGPSDGSLGSPELDVATERRLRSALAASRGGTWHCGTNGDEALEDLTIFIDVYPMRARMIIFGAVDFTGALVKVAKTLDYHVTVCDARRAFATPERFPDADQVIVDWPQRFLRALKTPPGPSDAICVLTHDQKFDVPALVEALGTNAGYIGAMGSHRTNEARRARLEAEGLTTTQLTRLMAPIGIDIGARSPEETAIAICAEIIALRSATPVASLRETSGPIHRASSSKS